MPPPPDALEAPPAPALDLLAGRIPHAPRPLPPFAPAAMRFLADLSAALRADEAARGLADVQSFAFWCRRGNLERLASARPAGEARLGRGLLLHVAPANVPVTFAYSFAFGLLAGNAGIVRVPSRGSAAVAAICGAAARLLAQAAHRALAGMAAFVRYPQDSGWTREFSARTDGRLLWGGDAAIAEIRKAPLPPHAVELVFPDRTSLAILDAGAVAALDAAGLARLAADFYNDSYVMDQNACSSPHLVLWLGEAGASRAAVARFWPALARHAEAHYRLLPVQAVDRLTRLFSAVIEHDGGLCRHGEHVAVLHLRALPADCEALRGRYGLFWEYDLPSLDAVATLVTRKVQTMTVFGLDRERLRRFVLENGLRGIDRIVPVGKALDMDIIWDGMDLVGQLSRIVDLR